MAAAGHNHEPKGWQAKLTLGFRVSASRTVLADRRRYGPLGVQRAFYPEGPVCHVYLLHPPGGVVGGDTLTVDVTVDADAHALLTTPGATKFYRSAGSTARQTQRLSVGADAVLEWLPQENIFFPGANVALDTEVHLHGGARLAIWEINCLGRPAIDEAFDTGSLDSRLSIFRDGQPVLFERLRLSPASRRRCAQMAGFPVSGTLVISHAGYAALTAARALLPVDESGHTAATLIDDCLLVRYLGTSTEQARKAFSAVWQSLRSVTMGREASLPRIWAT